MKFSLPNSYYDFFLKYHILQLENALSIEEADQIQNLLYKNLLSKKNISHQDLWKSGKDLWTHDTEIKKILGRLHLGDLAHFLFKKRPIRLASMHILSTENRGSPLFTEELGLQEICCINPLLGGAMLWINPMNSEDGTKEVPNLLHGSKGDLVFFSENYPIPFPSLYRKENALALIFTFTSSNARYLLAPKDPLTHDLKKSGYVFGDLLQEEECPYLYR